MAKNISLSIFGTFGNPNGFTQTVAGEINNIKKYDLNPTAIQLFESTAEMYALRKEMLGRVPVISFIKYSYASEQGSSRGGTFVGASVINANGTASIASVVSVLNELHKNLISSSDNLKDGVIMVKHSDEFKIRDPNTANLMVDADGISDIDFTEKNKNLVVFTDLKNIHHTFSKGIDLLNEYDNIYFTNDEVVAAYVQKKGLYELIQEVGNIKQFTEKLQEVESQKISRQKEVGDRVLKEIDILTKEKNSFVKNHQENIDKNKEIHRKNAEKIADAERNLGTYRISFDQQATRLKELHNKLISTNLKQSERTFIEKEINDLKASFDREKRSFSEPARLDSFSEPGRTTSGISQKRFSDTWNDYDEDRYNRKGKSNGFSTKELLLIFGFVALLGIGGYTVWYFLFKPESVSVSQEVEDYSNETNETSSWDDSATAIKLIPEPTGVLSIDDTRKTVDKQFPSDKLPMHVDSVVYRIFKANPSHIGEPYLGKEMEYAEYLIQKNPNLFDGNKKMTHTENLQIPSYDEKKKQINSSSSLPAGNEKTENQDAENIKNPNDNQNTISKPSTLNNLK